MQNYGCVAVLISLFVAAQDQSVVPASGEPVVDSKPIAESEKPEEPQKPAADLDQILAEWEKAASKIRRLDGEFTRFKYDRAVEVEKRAEGTFALEGENCARYRTFPGLPNPAAAPKKKGKNGRPFDLKTDEPESWYWTGRKLIRSNDVDLTYELINFPLDGESTSAFLRLLAESSDLSIARSFVLGIPARQLKAKFRVVIEQVSAEEVWLTFLPRVQQIAAICIKAVLILDRRTWLPKALKQIDPTGSEMVHIFKNMRINAEAELADDLTKPNLEGYRQILNKAPPKTELPE